MFLIFSWSIFSLISLALFLLQMILSNAQNNKNFSLNPLESGFESLLASSIFSAPFFFLAMLFVLFDLELVLLLPGIFNMSKFPGIYLLWVFIIFFILITLLVEWSFSGLKWEI